jgi:hypothetical protein
MIHAGLRFGAIWSLYIPPEANINSLAIDGVGTAEVTKNAAEVAKRSRLFIDDAFVAGCWWVVE